MKIVGIIAEFNPMHNGHKYLIEKAKQITGADVAICLMSGNFTQAGNIALKDKFTRAKIAIENGFDAIIELPTIFATSSAEFFAFGAINILNGLKCIDYLCFGSETGNISTITDIAKKIIKNNDNIWDNITESMKEGISFAKAREYAISKYLSKDEIAISCLPNNILAIEYVKSLLKQKSTIVPIAIKREENNEYITSATIIREMIENSNDISKYVLNYTTILDNPQLNNNMYNLIKYAILSKEKDQIKNINGVTEGLENKLYDEINNSNNYNEFIQNVKSKRYQLSKIKRILINIMLDISKEDFLNLNTDNNCYAHIININSSLKNELLSKLNKNSNIPVITSLNNNIISNLNDTIRKSLLLDVKASNIYSILSNDKINRDFTNKL
ncbi:MAG: nucleotidyltransferase family protein [Clostridia bacterium]